MDAEYEKICLYCEHAAPSYDSERMLCDLRGIVNAGHKCRKFIYDPLKRIPRPPKKPELDGMPEI